MSENNEVLNFHSIFESAPDLYLLLDTNFTIIGASDAYLKATMVTREQIMGKNIFEAFPPNPDDPEGNGVENLHASLSKVVANKTRDAMAIQKYDIRCPASEGGGFEVRYWSPVNLPVLNKDNTLKYILHRAEDVTEFIRLQQSGAKQSKLMEELRTRAGVMEMEIYQRAQEIQVVNNKLQEANKNLARLDDLKSKFFSNLSHELRTPLMLILGPLEKILAHNNLSDSQSRYLKIIENNTHILQKHVNDLLDVAKLSAEKMSILYGKVDLVKLVRQTAALFETRLEEKKIYFSLETPDQIRAEIDADKIQRVIMNLLSNAIKFTPIKGTIKLTLLQDGNDAFIAIEDTGPGIPGELINSIFERFFQVEAPATRKFKGTGLGLSITKDFVELHNGSISVRNGEKMGAIFKIDLPLRAPPHATLHSDLNEENNREEETLAQIVKELELQQSSISKKIPAVLNLDLPLILVIEDNVEMNNFICDLLSDTYRTESVYNGREGVRAAISFRPDLIISDIMMPSMSGVEFVHEIRTHTELLKIPILIVTAKADNELCVQMLREGAQEFMVKPFLPSELKARIANLILAKKADDELERFIYLVSHDLKAPLPAMSNLINWIEEEAGEQLNAQSKKHFSLLRKRASRMSNLLDGLLKYSQAGQGTRDSEKVNTKELIETSFTQLDKDKTFSLNAALWTGQFL